MGFFDLPKRPIDIKLLNVENGGSKAMISYKATYSDMMAKQRTGQRKKLYNDDSPMPYTDLRADLGNIPIDEFLVELRKIMEISFSRLKNKGYIYVQMLTIF